ncbi:MAG: amidohydrolase family protein, partial [Kyrpidia sp.]|nr:amidohydrolase family protein [Kyrpidia sp.]
MRILIRNADILTMNDHNEVVHGDLLIQDDRIATVGETWNAEADRVIDAAGKMLLPGFVHMHIHLCQTLFRGQADD